MHLNFSIFGTYFKVRNRNTEYMNQMDQRLRNIAGGIVFLIGFIVFFSTAERSGSLWDCGEFIAGAFKLEVVHPPGAPLFILLGRMFAVLGDLFSANPATIAFAVNLMSGISTALAGMMFCWITIRLTEHALLEKLGFVPSYAIAGGGVAAGLASMFVTSVWFSAVEGEVYAMSLLFTAFTFWCIVRWYTSPDSKNNDRWLILAFYSIGLSIGVHLLSLLTLPVLAMFYAFKRYKNPSIWQVGLFAFIGLIIIGLIQSIIIVGLPSLWQWFEIKVVNGLGLPFHSGFFFMLAIVSALFWFGFRYAQNNRLANLQEILVSTLMVIVGYSTIIMVVIRANAEPPINMNDNYDITRLLPYINREQYGERPLLYGPQFDAEVIGLQGQSDRYGRVGDRYDVVEQKFNGYEYRDADKVLFPRMSSTQSKDEPAYRSMWMNNPNGSPTGADNIKFFFNYQLGWMYFRYFMWNFTGRQNFTQGYSPIDKSSGNWISGIGFLDQARLYDMSLEPADRKHDKSRNKYYFIPLILGILGLVFHFKHNQSDALGVLGFFIITGIGLIVYTNEPPIEPRERDYITAASYATFCIWIGMAVPYLILLFRKWMKGNLAAPLAVGVTLLAPLLLVTQNWDDMTRRHLRGAADYGKNFLESVEPNAILFTYGDNDTYPTWYAQEVENARPDVRTVNLSLIGIDYYINAQRKKKNEADKVEYTISEEDYRGDNNQFVYLQDGPEMSAQAALKFLSEDHNVQLSDGRTLKSYLPSRNLYIDVPRSQFSSNLPGSADGPSDVVDRYQIKLPNKQTIVKGDLAVLDIIVSNLGKRPIYFAVTSNNDRKFGLDKMMQMEGLASKIVPIKRADGSPLVDADKAYENIMTKFRWGNFDKKEMYVDPSFDPSRYAMSNLFYSTIKEYERRYNRNRSALDSLADKTGEEASRLEEKNNEIITKSVELGQKYFEVLPHNNFRYSPSFAFEILNTMVNYGREGDFAENFGYLVNDTKSYLDFVESIDASTVQSSFQSEDNNYHVLANSLVSLSRKIANAEISGKIVNDLSSYVTTNQ